MKTKISSILGALICMAFFLSSCSKTESYAKLIPNNPDMVMSISTKAIISDIEIDKDSREVKNIKENITKKMDVKLREMFDKIFEDPEKSGISLSKDVYIFIDEDNNLSTAFLFGVSDKEELKKNLDIISSEEDNLSDVYEAKEEGLYYSYIKRGNRRLNSAIVFNDEWMMIVGPSRDFKEKHYDKDADDMALEIVREVAYQAKQGDDKSFTSNEYFDDFAGADGLIKIWMPNKTLGYMYRDFRRFLAEADDMTINYEKLAHLYTFGIDGDKVKASYRMLTKDEKNKKFIDDVNASLTNIDDKFMEYIPQDAMFTIAANIDGEKLFNAIEKSGVLKTLLRNNENDMAEFGKFLKSINGNIIWSVEDLSTSYNTLYIATKNSDAVDNFFNKKLEMEDKEFDKISDKQYRYQRLSYDFYDPYRYDPYESSVIATDSVARDTVATDSTATPNKVEEPKQIINDPEKDYVFFGYNKQAGCSYINYNKGNCSAFNKPSKNIKGGRISGHKFHMGFNPARLIDKIKDMNDDYYWDRSNKYTYKAFTDNVEYIELFLNDLSSSDAVLTLKEGKEKPLSLFVNIILEYINKFELN